MQSHSREKAGRNDPCPCGSGKKYKHCCLSKESSKSAPIREPLSIDSPWGRQRAASDRLTGDLLKLAAREFRECIAEAWLDFNQDPMPQSIEKYPYEEGIFNPYTIFDWDPERPARRSGYKPRVGLIGRAYQQQAKRQLSELELLILEQAISRPLSFYEVVRSVPGKSVALRNLLIGEEVEVEEHSASKGLRPGDFVYAQIWVLPEVATFGRLAPRPFPPDQKIAIVELRAELRKKIAKQKRELSAADLLHYAELIRTVYLVLRDALMRPPKLQNTDGDPLVFHTLTFRIGSAQVAFDALASLAWSTDKEDLLDCAELNADGSLKSVEFSWMVKGNPIHKEWDNTIMGNLNISGRSLVAKVNSANRANKIRQLIEQRMGLLVTHLSTTTQTPEEAIKKRKNAGKITSLETETNDAALDPELQKEFAVQMQKEVEGWIHKEIPALGGRTPLEAVADSDGREMVEALLQGWERNFEEPGAPGGFRPDIGAVRRLLKLPVRGEITAENVTRKRPLPLPAKL
jgi:hypothetical protein